MALALAAAGVQQTEVKDWCHVCGFRIAVLTPGPCLRSCDPLTLDPLWEVGTHLYSLLSYSDFPRSSRTCHLQELVLTHVYSSCLTTNLPYGICCAHIVVRISFFYGLHNLGIGYGCARVPMVYTLCLNLACLYVQVCLKKNTELLDLMEDHLYSLGYIQNLYNEFTIFGEMSLLSYMLINMFS